MLRSAAIALFAFIVAHALPASAADPQATWVRSTRSGTWSDPKTWEGGQVPGAGARIQIAGGHRVTYNLAAGVVFRTIYIAGTLTFDPQRDTRLAVGLIKIEPGDEPNENGFDCEAHVTEPDGTRPLPALEVGTQQEPIASNHTATIQLVYQNGHDPLSCPAIVCCGGRMDFHGTPMNRTWVKLGETAKKGSASVTLFEPVEGWRIGDRVIVTATQSQRGSDGTRRVGKANHVPAFTEERVLRAVDGVHLTLDKPLVYDHLGTGDYRGEVANLSRNVVVETADASKERGHTMYHRYSAGSISYTEFRHLGKENVLGRYSLHFHLAGDTMRGSSVIGASIWDSHNRWLTIHGTNFLVVRDCVGYQSAGHGYYLEDGTEIYNVLDRNLAVQAFKGRKLPKQILPFDHNEGAGFWWSNSLNTFTNNVSVENDRYGYRFEATPTSEFNPTLPLKFPDGTRHPADIRTLPFVRFENNEAHCDGLYGVNLGEGVQRAGPDTQHPFIVKNLKIWEVHYAFRPQSPNLLVDDLRIHRAVYGVYHPNYDHHVYRKVTISETEEEPFNRGHDDDSVQYGPLTVDGLTFDGFHNGTIPLIQISDDNPSGLAVSHFRNVKIVNRKDNNKRALVNLGGGTRNDPTTPHGVPVFLHDYYGPGRHAKVVSTRAKDLLNDGNTYRADPPLTGDESKVAEVRDVAFPQLLDPVDDLPPVTVITFVGRPREGKVVVRGTTADNGTVRRVLVNGQEAKATAANFSQWEVALEVKTGLMKNLEARAEDMAGNKEVGPHRVSGPAVK